MAFELFVHPEKGCGFSGISILKAGEKFGRQDGRALVARDSLRTEAGLPLYGHEMGDGSGRGGERDLGVGEAGFGGYVKTTKTMVHRAGKPTSLGNRSAKEIVVRFEFPDKGVRMAHNGDPVLDKRGRVIGWVTSCAADMNGTLTGQAYIEIKHGRGRKPRSLSNQSAPEKAGPAPQR